MESCKLAGWVIVMATISATCGGGSSAEVHQCAGAGRWFPAGKSELRKAVEKYLDSAKLEQPAGRVVAIVSPHAGYAYSGPIAGYGFAAIRGKSYKRVIVLAPSHQMNYASGLRGISAMDAASYETPLGSIPVDRECVEDLLKTKAFTGVPEAHRREHSDENQLPFLQVALKPGWKLVPILIGYVGEKEIAAAAEALKPHVDEDTLIVVSSDFSHVSNANSKTQNQWTVEAGKLLAAKDYAGFVKYVNSDPRGRGTICGALPIEMLLKTLDEKAEGHVLKHAISGDMTGDYSYSVAYCSIVYTMPNGSAQAEQKPKSGGLQSDKFLSDEEEQTLLKLARTSLNEWINNKSDDVNLSKFDLTPNLRRDAGAFVTLHEKGRLRGCIGYIMPIKPLYETVLENARNASTGDPRFPKVAAKELPDIDIEISVMSPLHKIDSINEIEIGRHGLLIKKGASQGVFLPQVPVDQGWDLNQYLEGICRKAYLPRGAWKTGAELQVFTAQVFGEKEKH